LLLNNLPVESLKIPPPDYILVIPTVAGRNFSKAASFVIIGLMLFSSIPSIPMAEGLFGFEPDLLSEISELPTILDEQILLEDISAPISIADGANLFAEISVPDTAVENETTTISGTISNPGSEVARNFSVSVYLDDIIFESRNISYLLPNQEKSIISTWNATLGDHKFKIFVDSEDAVQETNETDNIDIKPISVQPVEPSQPDSRAYADNASYNETNSNETDMAHSEIDSSQAIAYSVSSNGVTNGDFETGSLTGWTQWKTTLSYVQVGTTYKHLGSYGLRIYNEDDGSTYTSGIYQGNVNKGSGQMSFSLKGIEGTDNWGVILVVEVIDSQGAIGYAYDDSSDNNWCWPGTGDGHIISGDVISLNSWYTKTVNFASDYQSHYGREIENTVTVKFLSYEDNGNAEVYIDDISISGGDSQFYDDFENGNLNKWDSVGNWVVDSSVKHQGYYSVKCTGGPSALIKNMQYANAIYEGYFRFGETNMNHYPAIPTDNLGALCYWVCARDTGHFGYYDGSYKNYPTDKTYTTNTWYYIKLEFDYAQQKFWVWIDGSSLTPSGISAKNANGQIGSYLTNWKLLNVASGQTGTMWADDVYVTSPDGGQAKWTYIAYLNGDCNLEEDEIYHLNLMEKIGSTSNVKIVAQLDRILGGDSSNGDWTTARRYYVTYDNDMNTINSMLIQDLDEKNMGDPQTLVDFVVWATTNYPADNYCLVLSDHGGGWYGICYDDSSPIPGDCLNAIELKSALQSIKNQIGRNINVVAFDACLMGMVEVGYQVKDCVNIVVGSEELSWSRVFPYEETLSALKNNPSMTESELASKCVDEYESNCLWGGAWDGTYSAYYTSGIDGYISNDLDNFASRLKSIVGTYRSQITDARAATERFDEGDPVHEFYDLYDFANEAKSRISDPTLQMYATNLMDSIVSSNSQINEWHGSGHPDAHGLSIYWPATSISSGYNNLDLSINKNWDDFLRSYLDQAPYVRVVYPNGGEAYSNYMDVSWYGSDADRDSVRYSIEVSTNGGSSWSYIGSVTYAETPSQTQHSYGVDLTWQPSSTNARVRITADDNRGGISSDTNDSPFTIDHTSPTIDMYRPKSGYLYINNQEVGSTSSGYTIIVGNINIQASASDTYSGVSRVEFNSDGLLADDSGSDYYSPYNWQWNPTITEIGTFTLKATAHDRAGNSAQDSISNVIVIPSIALYTDSQYYEEQLYKTYENTASGGETNEES
jgi:hypothetical protein